VAHDGNEVQSMSYRVRCTFTCDEGYRPMGDMERTCGLNGQWSGTPLVCKGR